MKAVASALLLFSGLLSAQQPFPTRPPAPAPLRPAQFPPFQEAATAQRDDAAAHREPRAAFAFGDAELPRRQRLRPAGKEGLSALVAELLTKGTPTRSADQIAATIEGVGGSLTATTGDDFFTVSTDVLSDQADLAFQLLGEVTRSATFPADELELARTRYLSSLEVKSVNRPRMWRRASLPRRSTAGIRYGRSATPASYKAITHEDVTGFAGRRLRPSGALLVVAGDMTLARGARARVCRPLGAGVEYLRPPRLPRRFPSSRASA